MAAGNNSVRMNLGFMGQDTHKCGKNEYTGNPAGHTQIGDGHKPRTFLTKMAAG
jgi:hypothetical protein